MKRSPLSSVLIIIALLAVTLAGARVSAAAKVCLTNGQCSSTEYCAKAEGSCNGAGTCTAKPTVCPFICGEGVCGCDGVTYCNSCLAAEAGVNIAHNGPC